MMFTKVIDVDVMQARAMKILTFQRAEYKCASTVSSFNDLKHYALNAPLYTHFTSPIRRYPDCIVHRLLRATIENKSLPKKWTAELCSKYVCVRIR